MSSSIAIIDYQMGNLRSVQKALEKVGFAAEVTGDADRIAAADKIILPGVGAFGDAIRELRSRDLVEPICEAVRAGKPFLGICLGLQMLFEVGLEGGQHEGLGLLPGQVVKFESDRFGGDATFKVPHMGWNQVHVERSGCPLMRDVPESAYFYFVHSYFAAPSNTDCVWLSCDYGGPFCAAVWRDNVFATQFHPEKSQRDGLQMLKNFGEL